MVKILTGGKVREPLGRPGAYPMGAIPGPTVLCRVHSVWMEEERKSLSFCAGIFLLCNENHAKVAWFKRA